LSTDKVGGNSLVIFKKEEYLQGVRYIPNFHYKMYKNFKADCPIADRIWKRLLTLPLYPDLKISEQNKIINIKGFIKNEL